MRRQLTNLAKPSIVVRNAYKSVASDHTVELEKDIKIGEHLAALGDTEATITWKQFVASVANKFDGKHFSRSHFWLACLREHVNPLHVIQGIENLRRDRGTAPPVVDFCVYTDTDQELDDPKEAFRKLDKLVGISQEFKAPYEAGAWFPLQKIGNLELVQHYTLVSHVGSTDKIFGKFASFSSLAPAFFKRHIEKIAEHSQGKDQAEHLTKLMDSMANFALTHDANHQLKLNGNDVSAVFEASLSAISEKISPASEHERYGHGYYIGKYVDQTYSDPQEYERVAQVLGKSGVNGMTRSLGQEVIKDPSRFMPLAEAMGKDDARRLFAEVVYYTSAMTPEETLLLVDEYDRWYTNLGLGTILKADALWTLTRHHAVTELLHQRGLVDYPAMTQIPGFSFENFCDRKNQKVKEFLNDRSDIERFVKLCVESGAQDHLKDVAETYLTKNKLDKRLASESLHKDFFEVVLETKALDPDALIRNPNRIQKMVDLGVSPQALRAVKKYSNKWLDKSFGSDLGL